MKYIYRLSIASLLVLMVCPNTANAQFWKKLFSKKNNPREGKSSPIKTKPDVVPNTPKLRPRTIAYPKSTFKSTYRIDVLVPLYLDEGVVNNKVVYKKKLPTKVLPSIYFVEGLLLAADSLKNLGYKLDIHIHDGRHRISLLVLL